MENYLAYFGVIVWISRNIRDTEYEVWDLYLRQIEQTMVLTPEHAGINALRGTRSEARGIGFAGSFA